MCYLRDKNKTSLDGFDSRTEMMEASQNMKLNQQKLCNQDTDRKD